MKELPEYTKSYLALRNGQDLTDELKDAPHTELVFAKFKLIGKLVAGWLVSNLKFTDSQNL